MSGVINFLRALPVQSLCGALIGILLPVSGLANSEGPPWGNAGGPGRDNCTSCHFDSEAVSLSPALSLQGLDERLGPGQAYPLLLRFRSANALRAGFLIMAEGTDGAGATLPAGSFKPVDEETEANGAELRSNTAGSRPGDPNAVEWRFEYNAPQASSGIKAIRFYIAANAGNDDESPFGDIVHLQAVRLPLTDQ